MASKIADAARYFLHPETWRVLASQRGRRPSRDFPPARVELLEEDAAAGLRLVEVGGARYWLPATMDWAGLGAIHPEVFDPAHGHYYEHPGCALRPGDVAIDAGASEGFFTRFALDRGARVIAVEPWPPMAEALRRTFAAEVAAGRVEVVAACLGAAAGEVTLRIDPRTPWGGSVHEAAGGTAEATVPLVTLDALVARSDFGRCDFVKMDIEGAEVDAVAGAAAAIRRDRPCFAIAVYHRPGNYLDIRRALRASGVGYRVAAKGLQRYRPGVYVPMVLHAWAEGRPAAPEPRGRG